MAWEHGTNTGYRNHGCRCDLCREVSLAYEKERVVGVCLDCGGRTHSRYNARRCDACERARREAPHGTESRYNRCKCDLCREAARLARARRRARARPG